MAWRRFAAAGLVPGSLVGWELFAYGKQRQKFDDAKKTRPKPLVEGSTAWLIERDARTLDLVCVRHKALDRGPAAALADAAARVDEAYPYDGVGVVVVERDGVSRVLRADLNGTVTATPLASLLRDHAAFAEVALVPLVWNDDDREAIATPARRFFAEALLRCGSGGAPRFAPWAALRDARVAPLPARELAPAPARGAARRAPPRRRVAGRDARTGSPGGLRRRPNGLRRRLRVRAGRPADGARAAAAGRAVRAGAARGCCCWERGVTYIIAQRVAFMALAGVPILVDPLGGFRARPGPRLARATPPRPRAGCGRIVYGGPLAKNDVSSAATSSGFCACRKWPQSSATDRDPSVRSRSSSRKRSVWNIIRLRVP